MTTKVDPFMQPIPARFASDRELRAYYEYLHRFLHDIWERTGGSDDNVSNTEVQEKYAWQLAPTAESSVSDVNFETQIAQDRFNAVTAASNYIAVDFDYINAKNKSTITLPEYPKDNSVVIIRNGDGSTIRLNGNSRKINGENTGRIYRKGTALTLQYFIEDNEWFAR